MVYSILLNIATNLELRKVTHAVKLELLEATLVTLESYKRRYTASYYSIYGRYTKVHGPWGILVLGIGLVERFSVRIFASPRTDMSMARTVSPSVND